MFTAVIVATITVATAAVGAVMCGSRKYPYPPHGRSLEIPRGRGISTAKIYKGKYGA